MTGYTYADVRRSDSRGRRRGRRTTLRRSSSSATSSRASTRQARKGSQQADLYDLPGSFSHEYDSALVLTVVLSPPPVP